MYTIAMEEITLAERMVRYLENSHRWVSKKELMDRAREADYTYDETVRAFIQLRDVLHIGINYVSPKDTKATLPPGEYYIFYNLTPEERERLTSSLFFFEEM